MTFTYGIDLNKGLTYRQKQINFTKVFTKTKGDLVYVIATNMATSSLYLLAKAIDERVK